MLSEVIWTYQHFDSDASISDTWSAEESTFANQHMK